MTSGPGEGRPAHPWINAIRMPVESWSDRAIRPGRRRGATGADRRRGGPCPSSSRAGHGLGVHPLGKMSLFRGMFSPWTCVEPVPDSMSNLSIDDSTYGRTGW
jgi:hypothetical protein